MLTVCVAVGVGVGVAVVVAVAAVVIVPRAVINGLLPPFLIDIAGSAVLYMRAEYGDDAFLVWVVNIKHTGVVPRVRQRAVVPLQHVPLNLRPHLAGAHKDNAW